MKLLLDANLLWRMVVILKQYFEDSLHVDNIDLAIPAKDIEIWNYAVNNNLIIVTNDEDFVDFVHLKGFPPKVIVLRTGNRSRLFVSNYLYNESRILNYLIPLTKRACLKLSSDRSYFGQQISAD